MHLPDTIEHLPTLDLVPYARNSRTHSAGQIAQVAASIQEFGFTNPILIRGAGIVAGHGRVLAAKSLGMASVPVIRLDHLTEAQARAYVIADNRLAELAGWDNDILADELRDLQGEGFDMSLTGFADDDIDELLFTPPPELTDKENVPPVPIRPTTVPGDIWTLGHHTVMCGDSTSVADVATLMAGEQAAMVWTDPPYNVAVNGAAGSIMNDSMSDAAFRDFMAAAYARYAEAMKPGAVIYVAHAESERTTFTQQFVAAGMKLSQVLIWVKQGATFGRQDFNWRHEPILYGWKEGAGHYWCKDYTRTTVIDDDINIDAMKKPDLIALLKQIRDSKPGSVIYHDRPTRSDLHPTMKPVALVEKMIGWSSRPGWLVLDLFGGSGSTLIACEHTGRRAKLMELDPKFCDVIVRRWQDYTGKTATHAATGATFPS